jgi:raffinose/stachyose/melibiose transport system permease protein
MDRSDAAVRGASLSVPARLGRRPALRRGVTYALFIAPAFVLFTVFIVYPMLSALKFSFFEWNGLQELGFVGLRNFGTLFTRYPYDEQILRALGHNVLFFIVIMILQNGVGLFFALLIHRGIRGRSFWRNAFFLPHLLPIVVAGFLWTLMLNPQFGVINRLLEAAGLDSLTQPWLGDPSTAFPAIMAVSAWSWIGFPMVIFLANMAGIPQEYEEAARVDGASEGQVFRHITLPLLIPSITIVTVLTFIGNFNAFDIVYSMGGSDGGPAGSADVLALLFYRIAFDSADPNAVGVGNALAMLMFVAVFGVSNLWLRFFAKREVTY